MGRMEWAIVLALLAVALLVMISGGGLDRTVLGAWLNGEPLPPMAAMRGPSAVVAAMGLLALLVWWASRLFPGQQSFLRTGAVVLLVGGVVYALAMSS